MNSQCTCGTLAQWVNDPAVPVEALGEGYVLRTTDGTALPIRICPVCGGASQKTPSCGCGTLNQWSKTYAELVEFDSFMNEFKLDLKEHGKLLMYFCPECGGRLPASRRTELFQPLSESERLKLEQILKGAYTVEEIEARLGPADRTIAGIDRTNIQKQVYEQRPIQRQLIYDNVVSSASIVVQEFAAGDILILFPPKPK